MPWLKQAQLITMHSQDFTDKGRAIKEMVGCLMGVTTGPGVWTENERFGSPQLSWIVGPNV